MIAGFVLAAVASSGFDVGPEVEPPASGLPLERAARPLVLPKGTYQVDIIGRGTMIAEDEGLFRLDFGGTMGIGAGLQVRLDLVRWNFSRVSGYGLEQPRLALAYGFLDGWFELAVEAGAEVPSGGDFAGDASLATRLHGGRWLRFDVVGGVAGSSSRIRPESLAFGRAGLVLTPVGPLSVSGGAQLRLLTLTGAETLAGRLFADVSLAFPRDEGEVAWEIVVFGASPQRQLEGRPLDAPRFGYTWTGGLSVRLFFDGPASSDRAWGGDEFLR